jgi:hypothetical protein
MAAIYNMATVINMAMIIITLRAVNLRPMDACLVPRRYGWLPLERSVAKYTAGRFGRGKSARS